MTGRYVQRNALVLFLCAVMVSFAPLAGAQAVPDGFDHQGYMEVDGSPFNGNGAFRFALVDGSGNNVWTNDGSELGAANMPASAVALTVTDGIYAVSLGDGTTTDAFPANLFTNNSDLRLRVWFGDGTNGVQQLSPDKPVRTVPYASRSQHADTAAAAQSVPSVITVDRVEYSSPREKVLRLPPPSFVPESNSTAYSMTNDRIFAEGGGVLVAPVILPDGATITQLRVVYVDDDNDSNVSFELRRNSPDGSSPLIAAIATADESGVTTKTDDSLSNNVVDNTAYHYTLEALDTSNDWGPNPNLTTELIAAEITYTIDEAP